MSERPPTAPHVSKEPLEKCQLCDKELHNKEPHNKELCDIPKKPIDSHIIPRLVSRAIGKELSSFNLTLNINPKVVHQDTIKLPFLCETCEADFGELEKTFTEKILHPYLKNPEIDINLDNDAFRFLVSVSWRSLRYSLLYNRRLIVQGHKDAEYTWRKFLLRKADNIGEFKQYLLLSRDFTDEVVKPLNLSHTQLRYAISFGPLDLCTADDIPLPIPGRYLTSIKMGPILLFGLIYNFDKFRDADSESELWNKIEAHPENTLSSFPRSIPRSLLNGFSAVFNSNLDHIKSIKKSKDISSWLATSPANVYVQRDRKLYELDEPD